MKRIIVAYDRNRAIGANNTLPWAGKMKTDMRRVRELTTGNAIIMGRNTFESIGRALPGRQNIVITHRPLVVDGIEVAGSLEEAYALVDQGKDTYIFGGSQIYMLALDTVDEIVATEIDARVEQADAFFPALDGSKWREKSRESYAADADNAYSYVFITYCRP